MTSPESTTFCFGILEAKVSHLMLMMFGFHTSDESSDRLKYKAKAFRGNKVYSDYEQNPKGKHPEDWWPIQPIMPSSKERMGYATQKPLALLERIIKASSNPGDVVFDPFCGCGTTVVAAHALGRQWIGIDISGNAVDEIKTRLAERSVYDGDHYDLLEGSPDTMAEYQRLNPYEKQDWLIRRLGGLPNPRKSGDAGIDGDMTFHLGIDKTGKDLWGKMIFSVKTGKQRNPAHIRELQGTVKNSGSHMGILILDTDPTSGMESAAEKAGQFKYQQAESIPPKNYSRIQIVTADEVIEGAQIDCPPTMQAVKNFRKAQQEMRV